MKKMIFIAALALVACAKSPGERAEEAYETVKNSGAPKDQLCRSAQAVEQAYRASDDTKKADQWGLYASIDCNAAALAGAVP